MIPRYSINVLRSLSNWLAARSTTVWAKAFGHTETMQNYSKSLSEIVTYLQTQYEQCKRCGGTNGPLFREVDAMDCQCVPRRITIDTAVGTHHEVELNHQHHQVTVVWPKYEYLTWPDDLTRNRLVVIMIKTGPHFKTIEFDGLAADALDLNPSSINMVTLAQTKSGYTLVGLATDFK